MTTPADSTEGFSQTLVILMSHLIDILPNGEEINLMPAGIQYSTKTKSIIGNGVVIDAKELLDDLNALTNNGIEYKDRLFISSRYIYRLHL